MQFHIWIKVYIKTEIKNSEIHLMNFKYETLKTKSIANLMATKMLDLKNSVSIK